MSEIFITLLKEKNLEVYQGTKKYTEKRELEMFEVKDSSVTGVPSLTITDKMANQSNY